MNKLFVLIVFAIFLACDDSSLPPQPGQELISKSQKFHDPNEQWKQTELAIHIREPRLGNPGRFSLLKFSIDSSYFELTREIEPGMASRIVESGISEVLLNGAPITSDETKERFGLSEQRNEGYKRFYEMMYGLPMSLSEEKITFIGNGQIVQFNGENVYQIEITLEEKLISKDWVLMLSDKNFSLKALILNHNDSEQDDELIIFDGEYPYQGINIPRFRHWYRVNSNEYRGSDIIVKELIE